MSRGKSRKQTELFQVWKALWEVDAKTADWFVTDLAGEIHRWELYAMSFWESNIQGKPLQIRRAALEARALIERIMSEMRAASLDIEAARA